MGFFKQFYKLITIFFALFLTAAFVFPKNIVFAASSSFVPELTVTNPNGGEMLNVGQSYRITWDSFNIDTVLIGYTDAPGSLDWISPIMPNVGYYDWTVNVGNGVIPQARIVIKGYDNNGTLVASSESNAPFNIIQPTPTPTPQTSLTVTSPNGGEVLNTGQTYRITWNSTSNINKVTLGYSFGPNSLNWIADNIPNIGYYDWSVNAYYPTDMQVKIEVDGYSINSGQVSDQSDNFFTVLAPTPTPSPTETPTPTPTVTPEPTETTNPTSPEDGNNGYNNGFNNGYNNGYNNGFNNNYNNGFNNGYNNFYNNGYNNGYIL